MRLAFALPLILACGLAGAAMAQSVDTHSPTGPLAPTPQKADAQKDNPEAAAALAMSMRAQEAKDRRIAEIACAAGDTSKCAKSPTSAASTPH